MFCSVCLIVGAIIAFKVYDWWRRLPTIEGIPSKYVLITGCDRGFGNQLAKRLDQKGFNVIAACLTEKGEDGIRSASSERLKTIRMDVTSDESITSAYNEVKRILPEGKGLWGLVNNAGILGKVAMPDWLSRDDYRPDFEINTLGLIQVTTTFVPLLKKAKGRIVNMSSIAGRFTFPTSIPYSISKYGVESFSDGARQWLRPFGVSVHMLEPGFFRTDLFETETMERRLNDMWNNLSPEIRDEYGEDWYRKFSETTLKTTREKTSTKTYRVVDCMEHALTSVHPRPRYTVGFDAKLLFIPLSLLPAEIHDFILQLLSKAVPPKGASR
ncbi:17-beta-hydroxysteroid dehydrogenase type 6-like isoform X2 [Ptychodera flava]